VFLSTLFFIQPRARVNMDFEQLRAFVEVARNHSFSRAAEKMFRTQPAVSAQIKTLEQEVGTRLFHRSGGRVSLTESGQVFLEYADGALLARRQALRSMEELERTPRGELSVAANEATCLYLLPQVFAEFQRLCPQVSVSIRRAERLAIVDAVLGQRVDFGVISLPVSDPRLIAEVIHTSELVLLAPADHPVHAAPTLSEVARHPLLVPKQGRTREALEALFAQGASDIAPNISMELDSSELLKRFVTAGLGLGFLPWYTVKEDVAAGTLRVVAIPGVQLGREMALIYRKDKALGRAGRIFREIAERLRSDNETPSVGKKTAAREAVAASLAERPPAIR
jgi:LysR family transcriptional regulator, low CO2-responsive transcriptional regulator